MEMMTDRQLEEIYVQRNNEYIALEKQGLTREEILPRLEHYQDEIDALVYPNGKKKTEPPDIGDVFGIYRILGSNIGVDGEYSCPESAITINGKQVYARFFIRRIGTQTYQGCGEYILEMKPEEIDDYINRRGAYVTMRIQKGRKIKKIKMNMINE